ncbi:dTDP-glucose 4,6-dehydratase, partial [bacterium]|nr:dTDP-glucose 4,6-dehydratase [bacterium]
GFIGSNFIRFQLASRPDVQIVNLDKLTYAGNPANLASVENDPRYRFVKGDIADATLVNKIVSEGGFDVIVNYAAETHVDRSIMDPTAFLTTALFGVHALLEAVRVHNVPRFIQISTDEVFGAVMEGESADDARFEPRSPYSAAKAASDHLVASYWHTYQTPVIITHACNMYGPHHYPEKLFPLFITNLMEEKKVPVYGDGMQVREWMHIDDHARAIDALLTRGTLGESYNVGTGDRVPNIEVTKKILALCGKDEASIEYVKDRAGHDRRYAISSEKIRAELGWAPQISFDDGLAQTVAWFKANEAWWKPIKNGDFQKYYEKQYVSR